MASLGTSVEDRQRKINADIKKHAQELDRQNPGSTFEAKLKAYGENGEYLALVTGPFANLSSDFNALVDLIARERAFRLIIQCRQFVSSGLGSSRLGAGLNKSSLASATLFLAEPPGTL